MSIRLSTVEYTIKHGSIINHTLFLVVYRPRTPPLPPRVWEAAIFPSTYLFFPTSLFECLWWWHMQGQSQFFGQVSSSSVKSAAWAVVEAPVRERSDRCSIQWALNVCGSLSIPCLNKQQEQFSLCHLVPSCREALLVRSFRRVWSWRQPLSTTQLRCACICRRSGYLCILRDTY